MKSHKLPILTHIITGLNSGGAENFLLRLISNLKSFQHHIISLAPLEDKNFVDLFREHTESITSLNITPKNIFHIYKIFALSKILKQQTPNLIQTWMYHADLMGGIAAKMNHIPNIWNIRNGPLNKENPNILKFNNLTNYIIKAGAFLSKNIPDSIICCSKNAAKLHQKWGYKKDKFIVIPNGIDTNCFYPQPNLKSVLRKKWGLKNAKTIGFVGRFHPQKDIPNFLKAARIFLKHQPNTHFIFCGSGLTNENSLICKWIAKEGIKKHCHLLGKIHNIHEIYNGFDICSSSSYGEAFPNVIAEAMACGVPCVGTDVGDTDLIIGNQGLVVPTKNPQKLADAWQKLLSNPTDPNKIRQRIIDNFNLFDIGNIYSKIYSSHIQNSSRHCEERSDAAIS